MKEKIDEYLWNVKYYLMRKHGCHVAEMEMYPLMWYINTGRASTDFLKRMIGKKPYMIARKLHEGGSIQDAVDRVKAYVDG